ncbi:hypothetical protein CFP56_019530 [Quercus suber]|uniref:Uncharacterized protein n=1 Tax=Quercus suber TaxID=58331 RepID=A0AAW0KH66_QUESU
MAIVLDRSNPNSNLDILGILFSRALHTYGKSLISIFNCLFFTWLTYSHSHSHSQSQSECEINIAEMSTANEG